MVLTPLRKESLMMVSRKTPHTSTTKTLSEFMSAADAVLSLSGVKCQLGWAQVDGDRVH